METNSPNTKSAILAELLISIVSNAFVENDCDYSIKQFKKKEIVLPEKDIYQPSIDGFLLHRKKWRLN